jgi:hypothetical protein
MTAWDELIAWISRHRTSFLTIGSAWFVGWYLMSVRRILLKMSRDLSTIMVEILLKRGNR